ncbi:MAG: DsbA family protein [Planctomycetota bacterium]|nr:DsbA family protein [Planctomycetota bacterium]
MTLTLRLMTRPILVALCAAGAWTSGELVTAHAGPWPSASHGTGTHSRICGTGQDGASQCAAVLNSDWSAFDFDVPVLTSNLTLARTRVVVPAAFFGLAYFIFLGTWCAFVGPPTTWGRRWAWIPGLTLAGGAAASLAFVWVMFFELESVCRWCLAVHAINGLLLVGTICAWPRNMCVNRPAGGPVKQSDPIAAGRSPLTAWTALRVCGFAAMVIAGLWLYRGAKLDVRREVAKLVPFKRIVQQQQRDPVFLLREFLAEPRQVMTPGVAVQASASTSEDSTLVVFSDFQCGHCACFASLWEHEFRNLWQGSVRMEFRHYPLCRQCNPAVSREIHPEACRASYAAEAARLQGGERAFRKMRNLLFGLGKRLQHASYADLGRRIGLDGERLLSDMEGAVVRRTVAEDLALAKQLGVSGTPAVFLDGRRIPTLSLTNPVFWKAIAVRREPQTLVATAPESNPDDGSAAIEGTVDP